MDFVKSERSHFKLGDSKICFITGMDISQADSKFKKVEKSVNNFWVVAFKNLDELVKEWMNLADFLHAHTYSGKLKVTSMLTVCSFYNMGVAF